jgi:hypothetical protein
MGNTALIGAKMFLFMPPDSVTNILSLTRHINLEGHPDFQEIYVEKMIFLDVIHQLLPFKPADFNDMTVFVFETEPESQEIIFNRITHIFCFNF